MCEKGRKSSGKNDPRNWRRNEEEPPMRLAYLQQQERKEQQQLSHAKRRTDMHNQGSTTAGPASLFRGDPRALNPSASQGLGADKCRRRPAACTHSRACPLPILHAHQTRMTTTTRTPTQPLHVSSVSSD